MIFELIEEDDFYLKSCIKITGNRNDGYDLMMDTAIKISEKDINNYRSYFYRSALNNWQKQKQLTQTLDFPVIDDRKGYSYFIDCVLECLEHKGLTKREFVTVNIFRLYLKHKTQRKVSEVTGISRKTIHNQIHNFKEYALKHCKHLI